MIYLTMRSPPLHFSKWQESVSLLYFYSSPPSRLVCQPAAARTHRQPAAPEDVPCADVWQGRRRAEAGRGAGGRDSGGMLAVVGFSLMCNSYHWVVTLMSSVQRLLLYEEGNSWCCQTVVYYCYECNYH